MIDQSTSSHSRRARSCTCAPLTARAPGAIGIVQLNGECMGVLSALTGVEDWPIGRLRLVSFAGIDEGLAGRIDERTAQIMPHGGLRVMQKVMAKLIELGAQPIRADELDAWALYPEAQDAIEAIMLKTLASAASPLAIDLLLGQPAIWRRGVSVTSDDHARSERLNRLLTPPLVIVAGPANVGKSTLSNALIGRSMSIALDLPGTTRDYTVGRVELAGLAVQWHDTPGLRTSEDPIEQRAIELAQRLMTQADLLVAMTDHEHEWPALPREPDVRVANKCDLAFRDDADASISAMAGEGIEAFVHLVRERLVPEEDVAAARERPWVFDEKLMK